MAPAIDLMRKTRQRRKERMTQKNWDRVTGLSDGEVAAPWKFVFYGRTGRCIQINKEAGSLYSAEQGGRIS